MIKRKLRIWEEAFEEFYDRYPIYTDRVVDWYPSGCKEITIELDDGTCRTFNYITKKVSVVYLPDIDREYEELTDEELYRKFQIAFNNKLMAMSMSQDRLSKITGISYVTISKYSNGKALPNYQNLRKICSALRCSPTELYIYK